jgi:chromatin assembly factor 1 subunit B
VVAANPILYCLPDDVESFSGLAYKTVFCVLTENSILIYDTYHTKPLAMARGLHFSGLTDAIWTPNGRALIVSSSDGYLSVIQFEEGELGKVYVKPPTPPVVEGVETNKQLATSDSTEQPEAKRARLVSPATVRERFHPESQLEQSVPVESGQADENREAAGSSTKSGEPIVNVLQPKKKKRAQLHLVSTNVSSGN